MVNPARHLKFFAFIFVLGSTVCHASSIGYAFSGSIGESTGGGVDTYGFQFTTLADVVVDSLGVMDVGQDGLAGTEKVGIWDSTGTLLFSDSLGTGTLEGPVLSGGQFSFTSITPLLLPGGHTYTIGVQVDGTDDFVFNSQGSQSSGVPSLLTVSASTFTNNSFSLSDPTVPDGYYNFDVVNFTVADADAPEPVSAALAVSGLAAALLLRRRKNNARPEAYASSSPA